jgi:hypothetical protein
MFRGVSYFKWRDHAQKRPNSTHPHRCRPGRVTRSSGLTRRTPPLGGVHRYAGAYARAALRSGYIVGRSPSIGSAGVPEAAGRTRQKGAARGEFTERCPAGGADGRRSPKISPEDQTDVTTGFAGPDLIQMNIKNEDVGRKLSQGCLQVLRGGLGRPLCRLCLYRARRGRTDRGTHGFNVAA